ncbi:GTPase BMS1 [Sugiyamaella lignohabitans]|uniref:GTPase BMS1 n=1 Tax=Sugiyamaella lignohabitans TaxID=796027 RepID=A0A167FTF3_9ASCO|nr:GTPase BMS1 [Sugiyamaella lignohabitans]ANB15681.1 GTPase BMS1 [Sugiyamaella lignohabitans]
MVDRTPDEPPPVIVAVVGPPGTGKTTLIKSLVRRFTKHTLSEIKGPITVVSGKRRRLTFLECTNDLNSMIDIAKVADLILLMIDGNFGLEMETMEFLNILAPHGFPRILGVTTHLDLFKSVSTMRASKKALKHRFWTEVYQGAKLFYLSGVINGRYPDREILNLARFISVMKFRPLKWRNEHPYLVCDRVVDITHPSLIEENSKVDRKVTLYGYVHGTPLPYLNARVHIPGIGDLTAKEVERLPDPCPTPFAVKQEEQNSAGPKRRRRLDDKMKLIYAPMSDVGGVLIDKDAVYIDVGKESFIPGQEQGVGERLVTGLQNAKSTLGEVSESSGIQLFSSGEVFDELAGDDGEDEEEREGADQGRTHLRSGKSVGGSISNSLDNDDGDDADEDGDENPEDDDFDDSVHFEKRYNDNGEQSEDFAFADSDSDLGDFEDDEDSPELRWKSNLSRNATDEFRKNSRRFNINKLLYLDNISPEDVIKRWTGVDEEEEIEESIEDDEEDFFTQKKSLQYSIEDDSQAECNVDEIVKKWTNPESFTEISHVFYVAPKMPGVGGEAESDEEVFGDFEDLEDGEDNDNTKNREEHNAQVETKEDASEDEGDSTSENDDGTMISKDKTVAELRAENAAKKEKLRLQIEEQDNEDREFGAEDPEGENETWHDLEKAKIAKQLEINRAEFDQMDPTTRDRVEGFRAGAYVRIVFDGIPCEFIENFDPIYPVLIGGLLTNEERFGFSQVRIKRHRWYKKILKTNDPIIVSLGWRRFQTIPMYTTSDSRTRNRMLKYTPEHMHCTATFYGPLVSPNTGFCAVTSVASKDATANFRICATGTVMEVDQTVEVVKKLKLVGYPYKIFKNTAFIKDMFTSALEVAKFEGASIKTVSGVRGQIKRALSKPEGHFRATFEDKVLMSDIIILRAWYQILPRKFYNPVTSLLLQDKVNWSGMRLTGQVRADMGIELTNNPNSQYGKIERATRRFNSLKVPKAIQSNLPFKSQIHAMKPQKKETYLQKRAVVLNGEEKKARDLMVKVMTLRNEKEAKRSAKKKEQREQYVKKLAKNEEKRADRERREKKEYFRKEGRKRSASEAQSASGSSKRTKH